MISQEFSTDVHSDQIRNIKEEVANPNSPLDGMPLDLMVDHRHNMRKAEARVDDENTLGGVQSLSGEEGTIWNHGCG